MYIPAKKSIREPTIRIDNEKIKSRENIKYVGIIIDKGLNFIDHVKHVRTKTGEAILKTMGLIRRSMGNDGNTLKEIYMQAVQPAMLYGSEIWGERAKDSRITRHLRAAQRMALLAITKAYRTTPTAALQVICGIPPIEIIAQTKYEIKKANKTQANTVTIKTKDRPHPANRDEMTIPEQMNNKRVKIAVVGSRHQNGKTSIGVVIAMEQNEIYRRGERISDNTSIDIAELIAIREGIKEGTKKRIMAIEIRSDRKGAIETIYNPRTRHRVALEIQNLIEKRLWHNEYTIIRWSRGKKDAYIKMAHNIAKQALEKQHIGIRSDKYESAETHKAKKATEEEITNRWQQLWDQEKTGRELYRHCKQVGREKINLSFKGTQFMTGHGNMKSYIKRFNLQDTNGNCDCNIKEKEYVDHIMNRCDKTERQHARQKIATKYGDLKIELRKQARTEQKEVEKVNEWANEVLKTESEPEDE